VVPKHTNGLEKGKVVPKHTNGLEKGKMVPKHTSGLGKRLGADVTHNNLEHSKSSGSRVRDKDRNAEHRMAIFYGNI